MLILPYIAFWAIVFASWEMMLDELYGETGCRAP
jgi:hypothetical protein